MTVTDQIRIRFVGYRRIVRVSGKDLVKKSAGIAGRDGQNSEAQVENLDLATLVEVPTVTNPCW
jgi:hypothetical protein